MKSVRMGLAEHMKYCNIKHLSTTQLSQHEIKFELHFKVKINYFHQNAIKVHAAKIALTTSQNSVKHHLTYFVGNAAFLQITLALKG